MRKMRWAGTLLGLVFSLENNARAQAAGEDAVRLAPVLAPAPPGEAESVPQSPALRDPTGDVTVVNGSGSNAESKEAADLLAEVPGVVVQDTGGAGQAKQLSFRGSAANGVLVLVDGVPMNGAGGIADLSLIPAAALDRVEVLRGAGTLFGSGALGGVVNLVTREPDDSGRVLLEGTAGSFGTQRVQASASGPVAGGAALVLINGLHTDGDFTYLYNPKYPLNLPPLQFTRTNDDAKLGEGLLKYKAQFGPWTARVMAEGAVDERGLAGSEQSPSRDDRQRMQRAAAGLKVTRETVSGVSVTGQTFIRREGDQFSGHDFPGGFSEVLTLAGGELSAVTLWGRHGLSFAASAAGEWLGNSTSSHPSWARLGMVAGDEIFFRDGALSLFPAVRLDRVGPFTGISPKLGGRARLPRGFELRANAGQAFRAPSFLELYVVQGPLLPNPDLVPERTLSGDVQLRHQTGRTDVAVGGFYNLSQDLIVYESYPPSNAIPKNFATASEGGLELEGSVTPHPWLNARAKYTWLHSEDLKDVPGYLGKELPNHPRHTAYARLNLGPARLNGHVELAYQSEQFTNLSDRRAPIPGRTVMGAGVVAQVPWVRGLAVAVEVKNLLDQQTEDLEHYPLPRRAVYGTLRFSLDTRIEAR